MRLACIVLPDPGGPTIGTLWKQPGCVGIFQLRPTAHELALR